jgi:DNA invertase Pin-like site-specific DNA recombinase
MGPRKPLTALPPNTSYRLRRYKREKKENGVRGKEKLGQNEPAFCSTAEKLATEYGVSPATVKRAAASYKAV